MFRIFLPLHVIVFLLSLVAPSWCNDPWLQKNAGARQFRLRSPLDASLAASVQPKPPAVAVNEAQFIDMPLDHFSSHPTSKTFKNRYWVNETYWKPGGPVFLFDSGEQNAEPLLPYYLQEFHGLSATMRLAKRFNGLAVLWEHRFYGDSLPFPINENTTAEQWQFLNTEQALEDVVFFANSFSKPHKQGALPNADININLGKPSSSSSSLTNPLKKFPVHPSTTPWIMLGGSYPGIRAAQLRIRNPSTIFASWASSAPVQAQIDMSSYYKAAERSLTRNCSADWVSVTRFVDGELGSGDRERVGDVKVMLGKARGMSESDARGMSDVDAAGVLMDPLDFYQYYGFQASLLPFCNLLETQNDTEDAFEGGVVKQFGIQVGFKAFVDAIKTLGYDAIPRGVDDPVQDLSWMWQYCSEYGYYQRGDPNNPLSIETSFLSLQLFQQQCNQTFPKGLPSQPRVENVNKYGGWNMKPSNVMFTNGEFDPWRTMGLASIEDNSPKRTPSVSIPKCNQPPSPPESFFGMTYPSMVHVSDLRVLLTPDANHNASEFRTVGFYSPVSQQPFFTGLGLFEMALEEWLGCFGK